MAEGQEVGGSEAGVLWLLWCSWLTHRGLAFSLPSSSCFTDPQPWPLHICPVEFSCPRGDESQPGGAADSSRPEGRTCGPRRPGALWLQWGGAQRRPEKPFVETQTCCLISSVSPREPCVRAILSLRGVVSILFHRGPDTPQNGAATPMPAPSTSTAWTELRGSHLGRGSRQGWSTPLLQ